MGSSLFTGEIRPRTCTLSTVEFGGVVARAVDGSDAPNWPKLCVPVCPQQFPASWIIAQLQASTESCVTLSVGAAVVDCKGCKVFHRPLCLVHLAFVHL